MKLFKLKIIFIFLLSSVVCITTNAKENIKTFDSANTAYANGDFNKAIELYERLSESNLISAELYYNLGNAYYKTNNIGWAILNYERAKKLNPRDEDLLMNLKLANQKTEDKIDAAPQLFLKEWKNGIINLFSEKEWAIVCIVFFTFSLLLLVVFILSHNSGLKKLGFYSGCIFFITTIVIFFIAQEKYDLTINSPEAIITSSTVTVTGSPNLKGTKLFILHEGTKVIVLQEEGEWNEITIPNGNVGWVKAEALQKI